MKLVNIPTLEWQIYWFCLPQSQKPRRIQNLESISRQKYPLNKNNGQFDIELRNTDPSHLVPYSEKPNPISLLYKKLRIHLVSLYLTKFTYHYINRQPRYDPSTTILQLTIVLVNLHFFHENNFFAKPVNLLAKNLLKSYSKVSKNLLKEFTLHPSFTRKT